MSHLKEEERCFFTVTKMKKRVKKYERKNKKSLSTTDENENNSEIEDK
jgi:hypothetical protein